MKKAALKEFLAVTSLWYKTYSILRKNLAVRLNSPMSLLVSLGNGLLILFAFFYVTRLFGASAAPYLSRYGGDYFPFIIIGLAFNQFYLTGEQAVRNAIYNMGHAESVLTTRTSLLEYISIKTLLDYLGQIARIILLLLAGYALFGMKITVHGIAGACIVAVLTIICSFSYGIITASFLLAFKRQLPVSSLLQRLQALLSGVYFPLSLLPAWLKGASLVLPMTYSLDGLRMTIIKGASLSSISGDVFALAVFSMIFAPLSIVVFKLGVWKAKHNGTLLFRKD
ncbi:MAG: ABC transporter permease [Candidatus Margulisiibacteriota bacterium]